MRHLYISVLFMSFIVSVDGTRREMSVGVNGRAILEQPQGCIAWNGVDTGLQRHCNRIQAAFLSPTYVKSGSPYVLPHGFHQDWVSE